MEWKIYEEWLDITLYRQMTNLITYIKYGIL